MQYYYNNTYDCNNYENNVIINDVEYISYQPEIDMPSSNNYLCFEDYLNFDYINNYYYNFNNNNNINDIKLKKKKTSLDQIKVRISPRCYSEKSKKYYLDKESLSKPQVIVCKNLSVNTSTFSRAFREAIRNIPSLCHLATRYKKKNIWPYRSRYTSEIIQYVDKHSTPIVVNIRNYNSRSSNGH